MKWLNEHSRLFLSRGYLTEGVTPEGRVRFIADKAEEILGIKDLQINSMTIWTKATIQFHHQYGQTLESQRDYQLVALDLT